MEVERKKNEFEFDMIADGECFIDIFNNVCIKINEINDEDGTKYNAVEVTSGDIFHYSCDEKVTAVKAKLVIE
jgi:hypothetical protein